VWLWCRGRRLSPPQARQEQGRLQPGPALDPLHGLGPDTEASYGLPGAVVGGGHPGVTSVQAAALPALGQVQRQGPQPREGADGALGGPLRAPAVAARASWRRPSSLARSRQLPKSSLASTPTPSLLRRESRVLARALGSSAFTCKTAGAAPPPSPGVPPALPFPLEPVHP